MKLNYDNASLLLAARQRDSAGSCLILTVGLLYSADQTVVPAVDAQQWLAERFAKKAMDHGLKKSRGSFAIHGSAYALSATQQQGMAVRANFGAATKTLHVFPPRQWRKGLTGWNIEQKGTLSELPLDWQHAYGAKDYPCNPEGIGYITDLAKAEGVPLPQIEDTRTPLRAPGETITPASLLPLTPQSVERMAFMGTCDEQWSKQRAPFLPLDTDPRWFDEVAQDQCIDGYWVGNEAWSVAGMHPQKLEVSGRLPGFRPRLFVQRRVLAGAPALLKDQPVIEPIEETRLELDTVWLFPDAERVLLLYRTQLRVTDIDGEDVAALGVGVEQAGEPGKSREQWIAELWPQPATPADEAPDLDLPEAADPKQFQSAVLAKLQASMDAHYASFAAEQQKVFASAKQTAAISNQTIDPARMQLAVAPNLAELASKPFAPRAPFDAAVLKAKLEDSIAAAKAEGELQFAKSARAAGHDPQVLLARTEALKQQALREAAANPSPQYGLLIDQLQLPTAQKNEFKKRIEEGMAKVEATEKEIKQKISAMHERMAIKAPKLPSLGNVPEFKARIGWTRELLEASHKAEEKLDGERFSDLDLSGLDLSGGVMQNCSFENCQLKGAKLAAADLSGGRFSGCDFSQADFQEALLDACTFKTCTFTDAKLTKASLSAVHVSQSPFDRADLTQAQAVRGQFVDSSFVGAMLAEGNFAGARWQGCDLTAGNLQEAKLDKAQFHSCVVDNTDFNRASLPASSWSRVTGRSVNLAAANLRNWRLDQGCFLPQALLDNADLSKASLQYVVLEQASLCGANLNGALLSRCDLSNADGYHANAGSADFTGSNLSNSSWLGANFLEARLRKVNLNNADLRGSNLHGINSEGAHGNAVRLEQALLSRCRLVEDLAHG
jgi:uncharacterized protein YjbI with pentapeptide repeats